MAGSDEQSWPLAIDPADCGCTECLTGEYVPLRNATAEQVLDMVTGAIGNNVGPIEVTFARDQDSGRWQGLTMVSFIGTDYRTFGRRDPGFERASQLTPDDVA